MLSHCIRAGLPKIERTIETVDANNGRRRNLVNADRAIAEMTELLKPEEPYEELGWPRRIRPERPLGGLSQVW